MDIEEKLNEKQGHWILAKLGKKVLRPGGRELTGILMQHMHINPSDDVVEFAPGLGFTAAIACSARPRSYTGVDRNKQAAELTRNYVKYDKMSMIVADASATTLPDQYASKVYGEAMLTMQPLEHKIEIIREAVRILKPGYYYGIHELGLQPDSLSEDVKQEIYKDLSSNIRVHARPLTLTEWRQLLEEQGLRVLTVHTRPMALLEFNRLLKDEGLFGTLKIFYNLMTHGELRRRVQQMRRTFKKHKRHMNAVAIVAQKKAHHAD